MRHRGRRSEEGVVLIEFAFVFALFVFILYALIAFGMALALKHTVTHAAGEGARAAVGVIDDPATTTVDERVVTAEDEVRDSMDWIGPKFDPADVTAQVDPCVASSGECITVKIEYPYSAKPIVPAAPGMGLVYPDKMTSTAVVKLNS